MSSIEVDSPHPLIKTRILSIPATLTYTSLYKLRNPYGPSDAYSTFHLFPNLPVELRRKILEYASSSGYSFRQRVFPATGRFRNTGDSAARCTFQPSITFQQFRDEMFDIGIAGTSRECREVYLEMNKGRLHVGNRGLLRFNRKSDIVHVKNFFDMIDSCSMSVPLCEILRQPRFLPSFFGKIEYLMLPILSVMHMNSDLGLLMALQNLRVRISLRSSCSTFNVPRVTRYWLISQLAFRTSYEVMLTQKTSRNWSLCCPRIC